MTEFVTRLQGQRQRLVRQPLSFHRTEPFVVLQWGSLHHGSRRFGNAGRLGMTSGRRVEFLQDHTHLLVAIFASQKRFHRGWILLLTAVALQGTMVRIQFLGDNAAKFNNASVVLTCGQLLTDVAQIDASRNMFARFKGLLQQTLLVHPIHRRRSSFQQLLVHFGAQRVLKLDS